MQARPAAFVAPYAFWGFSYTTQGGPHNQVVPVPRLTMLDRPAGEACPRVSGGSPSLSAFVI